MISRYCLRAGRCTGHVPASDDEDDDEEEDEDEDGVVGLRKADRRFGSLRTNTANLIRLRDKSQLHVNMPHDGDKVVST